MTKKITVGILLGGRSAEHEVSLQSAKSIIEAINKEKYELVLIGIDKGGKWFLHESSDYLVNPTDPKTIRLASSDKKLSILPGEDNQLLNVSTQELSKKLDVVFPVLHGPFGEDGTIQGLLKLLNLPYVGPDVLGSAVSMDKDVMKRLMKDAGIPNAKFITFTHSNKERITYEEVVEQLGMPVFIKPANMGSSVGVNKAQSKQEFEKYLDEAFEFDNKVVVEEFIKGRELECAVLGNENPEASFPGEILAHHEFYSYQAKYIDEKGATLIIPANVPDAIVKQIQDVAIRTFKVLNCEGMGRVDMFLTSDNKIYVNEINTIPGFTKISMYPKLWEYSGIPYKDLIDELIQLGIKRFERDSKLKTNYNLSN